MDPMGCQVILSCQTSNMRVFQNHVIQLSFFLFDSCKPNCNLEASWTFSQSLRLSKFSTTVYDMDCTDNDKNIKIKRKTTCPNSMVEICRNSKQISKIQPKMATTTMFLQDETPILAQGDGQSINRSTSGGS